MVSISVANVYVSLKRMAVTETITLINPCYKKLKNSKFSKRLEVVQVASIECDFYNIQF